MAVSEVSRMTDQWRRAAKGPAWHGPSIREVLKGVTARQAAARPIAGAHTIWELVLHSTAWIDIVRRRLEGTAPKRITAAMNWPKLGSTNARDWRRAVSELERASAELEATIRGLDDGGLEQDLPGVDDTWSAYRTVHGIIQHTLYHAGQIAVLKKDTA